MAEQKKPSADTKLPGGITQAQLDAWKEKHGGVNVVKVHLSEAESVTGYFKKPTRDVIANCVNMATEGNVYEAREFLANNTFIGGDARVNTDFDVSISAQINLWKSLNFLKAEVQKY